MAQEYFKFIDGKVIVKQENLIDLTGKEEKSAIVDSTSHSSEVSPSPTSAAARIIRKKVRPYKWRSHEIQLLYELVKESGEDIDWNKVSQQFPLRSPQLVKQRWELVQNPSLKKGPWTYGEDARILKGVRDGELPSDISRDLQRPFNSGGLRLRLLCKRLFKKVGGTKTLCTWMVEERNSLTDVEIDDLLLVLHPDEM